MLRHRLTAQLACALGLALAYPPALAHAGKPRGSDVTDRAKAHFKQGRAYQEVGAYDQAIDEYLEANRLAPRPELLFNIAQCYRLSGHPEQAIEFYNKFLQAAPKASGAEEARAYITALNRQLEAERTKAARAEKDRLDAERADKQRADKQRADKQRADKQRADKQRADKQNRGPAKTKPAAHAAPLDAPPAPVTRHDHPTARWLGIGGVATGAALVGVGAFFGWRAADAGDELGSSTGTWTPDRDAREEAAQSDEQTMIILVSAGSALVVGGAALWWWSGRGSLEAIPVVSHDHAGLTLRGRF